MNYFDSHTHAQFAAFDDDRDEVIKNSLDAGVGMVNVGTNLQTSKDAVSLSNAYADKPIFATVGLHPTHTYSKHHDSNETSQKTAIESEFNYDSYKELVSDDAVVAVGECGLDYFRLKKPELKEAKKLQSQALREQIALAKKSDLPLMIHCRPSSDSQNAYKDLLDILQSRKEVPGGIIHFFVGSKKIAKEFLDLGFHFTFGGVITFAREYDEVIKYIPLERVLLETDAPYVTPEPHRGKRNEPLFVKAVYDKMAELKNVPLEELQDVMLQNNERIFNIKI